MVSPPQVTGRHFLDIESWYCPEVNKELSPSYHREGDCEREIEHELSAVSREPVVHYEVLQTTCQPDVLGKVNA